MIDYLENRDDGKDHARNWECRNCEMNGCCRVLYSSSECNANLSSYYKDEDEEIINE